MRIVTPATHDDKSISPGAEPDDQFSQASVFARPISPLGGFIAALTATAVTTAATVILHRRKKNSEEKDTAELVTPTHLRLSPGDKVIIYVSGADSTADQFRLHLNKFQNLLGQEALLFGFKHHPRNIDKKVGCSRMDSARMGNQLAQRIKLIVDQGAVVTVVAHSLGCNISAAAAENLLTHSDGQAALENATFISLGSKKKFHPADRWGAHSGLVIKSDNVGITELPHATSPFDSKGGTSDYLDSESNVAQALKFIINEHRGTVSR